MSVTIDANVLVYASNEADASHSVARSLVERLAAGPDLVYLFWPTIMRYLRIVTHPAILTRSLSFIEARDNVSTLIERPHVRAPGEGDGFWDLYVETVRVNARGNEIPDAQIVALMRQHGVATIYTRDRDLRRYEQIDVRDPFA